MGIETETPIICNEAYDANFTNEGGVEGSVRFLKNITGMWLHEQTRKVWMKQGKIYSYEDIVEMARKGASFTVTVNPDDPRLANPADMPAEISKLCAEKSGTIPANDSELSACIFKSLACRSHSCRELHDTSPGCGTCLRQKGIQKVDCGQPAVRNETRVNIKKS